MSDDHSDFYRCVIGRPTYVVVGGLRFYRDLNSFLFISYHQLLSELAERNSTKTGHTFGSECAFKMHVRKLGYPLPLKIGAPNHLFSTFFDDFAN